MAVLTKSKFKTRFTKLQEKEKDIDSACDFIYWFIDVLGNPENVQAIIRTEDKNSTVEYVQRKGQLAQFAAKNTKSGIVFAGNRNSGGHFHSMVGNTIQDSYKLNYQIGGTNNFCQLFSIMIYLSTIKPVKYRFDLREKEYAHNIKVAMKFLKTFLQKHKTIRNKIIDDVRTFVSRDHPDDESWIFLVEEPRPLYNMTVAQFYEFIDNVSEFAQHFTNC